MPSTDEELLREYASTGSNPAFSELVTRYVDAVYSAAWRKVGIRALAEDITQSVFFDLSKNAAKLKVGQPLIAWLYLVTRRTAIDVIRHEARRQAREKAAVEVAAMKTNSSQWDQVGPFLDEALESLGETDRQAILLRYMASKSLREVGDSLGTSEDAAQKRVSRALEQLRSNLARRGVAITAAGLTTDLSAHLIISAPAGLGASISASILSTASVAVQTVPTLFMTALNKTLVITSLVLAAGLIYETYRISTGRTQVVELENKISNEQAQTQQLKQAQERAKQLLASKQHALASAQARDHETETEESDLEAWLGRVSRLKERLAQMPEKKIPEMRFLTFADWLAVTLNNSLQTEAKVRTALRDLRKSAKDSPAVARNLISALGAYSKEHDRQPATELGELLPYLKPTLDAEILSRYHFVTDPPSMGKMPANNRSWLMEKAAVDDDYDILLGISAKGWGMSYQYVSKIRDQVNEATQAFIQATGGQKPVNATQLLPYFSTPVDETRLVEFWEARSQR